MTMLELIYPESHVAITDAYDFREAALYFDFVFPFNPHAFRQKFVEHQLPHGGHIYDVARQVLPPIVAQDEGDHFQHFISYLEKHVYAYNIWLIEGSGDPEIKQFFDEADEHLKVVAPLVLADSPARILNIEHHGSESPNRVVESEKQVGLALMDLELVDTSLIPWDHLLEFRQDTKSCEQLRRLRLAFYQDYSGKERGFVEDDVQQRLADYHAACKKWDFKLLTQTLLSVMDSKSLLATASGTLAALLFGGPLAAVTAGAAIELGQVTLRSATIMREKREYETTHPLAYLTSIMKFE